VVTGLIPYNLAISKTGSFSGIRYSFESGVNISGISVSIPINYIIDLESTGNARFIYNVNYQNNGENFITSSTTLNYLDSGIQPTPFYVFKNCNQLLGLKLEDYTYDTDYIYKFGMEGVSYIGNVNSEDLSELYVFPSSHNKTNINNLVLVDRTSNTYILDDNYELNQLNLYENGVGLLGSGYNITGSIYNSGIEILEDFIVDGSSVLPKKIPDLSDVVILDLINGNRFSFEVPSAYSFAASGYIPNFNVSTNNLYLNGVKLLSGVDYITSGSNVLFGNSITGISGKIFNLPNDSDSYLRYTGNFSNKFTNKFARGTSSLYINGIRQVLDLDYMEIANASLLVGERTLTEGSIILNNSTGFWE
jgi:hypothetical protein